MVDRKLARRRTHWQVMKLLLLLMVAQLAGWGTHLLLVVGRHWRLRRGIVRRHHSGG